MTRAGDARQMHRIARETFGYGDLSSAQEEIIHYPIRISLRHSRFD
jgi:hypothetical protein